MTSEFPIDGVSASTLRLPPGVWPTVLDCLADHFAAIGRDTWRERIERGRVLDAEGAAIRVQTRYRVGLTIRYFREVVDEAPIPFAESIVHVDAHLVVADKPHFLPVTPAGRFVEETLLTRLRARFGNANLVPLHRIDRGTAGLVMFSIDPSSRSAYQALFREQAIVKRYEALAAPLPALAFPLLHRSRLERGDPFFVTRETAGAPNSETSIDVIERGGDVWRYALLPRSGRKHQLRVHMAALGAPIRNDPLYPVVRERAADDAERPLKLLARQLDFVDPLDGSLRRFESALSLGGIDAA